MYFVCAILFFFPYSANAREDVDINVCNTAVQPPNGGPAVQRPTIISCLDLDSACPSIFTLNNANDVLRDQANP